MVHDPQDREFYYQYGVDKEHAFCKYCFDHPELGLFSEINPEKKTNKYALDLVVNGRKADLKAQSTPFFTAGRTFMIPCQYCVTLNWADAVRYVANYDDMDIYFWVNWQTLELYDRHVIPMEGIYRISMARMENMVSNATLHTYQNRGWPGDRNKKSSYGLDVRRMERLYQRGSASHGGR